MSRKRHCYSPVNLGQWRTDLLHSGLLKYFCYIKYRRTRQLFIFPNRWCLTHTHTLKQLAVALWVNNGAEAFLVISVEWRKKTILLSLFSTGSTCFIFHSRNECPPSAPTLSTNLHHKRVKTGVTVPLFN